MKKPYIILAILVIGVISFLTYFILSNKTNLAFEKVEMDQLNTEIQTWINESCQDKKGIHFYEVKKEEGYEGVVYFNQYKDVYLYIAQEIDVTYKNDILTVSISDQPATHDSDVKNDFCLFIKMNKKPESIEFLLNNEKMQPENRTSGKIDKAVKD